MTPTQIIADIKALDRIRNDWSAEGRLDGNTEKDLADKRADLMDSLHERFITKENDWYVGKGDRWLATDGEMDGDYDDEARRWMPSVKYAYGATEIAAIEELLDLIGEDA